MRCANTCRPVTEGKIGKLPFREPRAALSALAGASGRLSCGFPALLSVLLCGGLRFGASKAPLEIAIAVTLWSA